MALSAHLNSLKSKHLEIDEQIRKLQQVPMPDSLKISELKRQKLLLKEQIEQLKVA